MVGKGKSSKAQERVDARRREVVEKIIADMERDGLRWSEPYLPTLTPHNPVTGTVYSGRNRLHLAFAARECEFADNRWCTFNQIRNQGWHLTKGATSAIIENWKEFPIVKENAETGEDEVVGKYPRLVGYWNVFNASQIEGIPPEAGQEHETDRTAAIADDLIASSRCPVIESVSFTGHAAYAPLSDRICIAPRTTFRSDESFTRTLLHEMTHSTGHPDALDRQLVTSFGSEDYAKEELVAELGSLFMSADLGVQTADMEGAFYENHVSYLKSWISALENDPDYLFRAAGQADRASAYLKERYDAVLERGCDEPEQDRMDLTDLAHSSRDAAGALEGSLGAGREGLDVTRDDR